MKHVKQYVISTQNFALINIFYSQQLLQVRIDVNAHYLKA
jgi:hypothetical protein